MVIGPVNMPLTIFFVKDCAYLDQKTVIGFDLLISPNIIGGFTHLEP